MSLQGKKIAIIDDSLVRGTNLKAGLVRWLKGYSGATRKGSLIGGIGLPQGGLQVSHG